MGFWTENSSANVGGHGGRRKWPLYRAGTAHPGTEIGDQNVSVSLAGSARKG